MAQWSAVWDTPVSRKQKRFLLHGMKWTKPAPVKTKKGGEFPHLQPFNKDLKG